MHLSHSLLIGTTALVGQVALADYTLQTTYDSSNFFDEFDFFTGPDPTNGFVEYVDSATAQQAGLAGQTADGGVLMRVDNTTASPQAGRQSVRLTSKQAFTHGLFIADIKHMPGSVCGSWPAYWMVGPNWPGSGEIDIIEGVNSQTANLVTLHTAPGCSITNDGATNSTTLNGGDCNAGDAHNGCQEVTTDTNNYGDGFNANGGGVYATEWTSDFIAVWFFGRSNIPADITSGTPNPGNWGPPLARFAGDGDQGCDIDSHFNNNNIVFDTTFCGDWAGQEAIWSSDSTCSAKAPSCQEYVSNNPGDFSESFWDVSSIKVYSQSVMRRQKNVRHQLRHQHRRGPK